MSNTRTIRWVIFHEPIDLFLRTANAFCDEIEKNSNGRLNIEVYSMLEYAKKFHNGVVFDQAALINSGEVQMSQLYVSKIGEQRVSDFYALEMPFLFRNHDHAARVLEGEIGKNLLEKTLPSKTSMRGLAFTYSGGYRVMASKKEIKTAEDLKGLTLGVTTNPVFADMATAFGCSFESIPERIAPWGDEIKELKEISSKINTVMPTLPRYNIEANSDVHCHVTDTKHSLYLTTIVINENFWNSLSIEDQMIISEAALNSARKERAWSIGDAQKITDNREEQEKLGIKTYYTLSAEESAKLEKSVDGLYKKYSTFFSTGLIDSIKKS
jgi:TRAP-type C4-dicarboxylate transport system substrate-binding protein